VIDNTPEVFAEFALWVALLVHRADAPVDPARIHGDDPEPGFGEIVSNAFEVLGPPAVAGVVDNRRAFALYEGLQLDPVGSLDQNLLCFEGTGCSSSPASAS